MTAPIESLELERLTLVCPVASSLRLDMPRLLDDGLVGWESGLGVLAGPAGGSRWRRLERVSHSSGMLFDIDTYAGAGLPDSLAYREISAANGDSELLSRINEVLAPLQLCSAELRCYDFGALVLRLTATGPGVAVAAGKALRWVGERSSALSDAGVGLGA